MLSLMEQEERDYHPQSELQNAYDRSRSSMPSDEVIPDDGKFRVVVTSAVYCRSTDAVLGSVTTVAAGPCDSREEAEAVLDDLTDDDDYELSHSVHPRLPLQPLPGFEPSESDMPF